MELDQQQRGIVLRSLAAFVVAAAVLGAGYLWFPPSFVGVGSSMSLAESIAFALKWDLLIFLWLLGCIQVAARTRLPSPGDRPDSASAPPRPATLVPSAVLQNSLEQTVIASGAHLILATVLRGPELVIIPLLVLLYLIGRIGLAAGYAKGVVGRAFGMALTSASAVAGYGIALVLVIAGR